MRNKLTKELAVCGINAVLALGNKNPQIINRLFLREERLPLFANICKELAVRKRPYKICQDEELEKICKSVHHQGIVAMIIEPEIKNLTREDLNLWAKEGKIGIVLYSVGNDHNLGAIVRSSAFFDAYFIVISETDIEAKLTTSAYRVAEGGMEYVKFRKVKNTEAFLKDANKAIVTIGAEPRARRRLKDIESIIQEQKKELKSQNAGIAIVVGNEEIGLPQSIKDQCKTLLRVPGTGFIESLNVAQATTLFLYELYNLF